jgi:AcrR family transcriptional regulator
VAAAGGRANQRRRTRKDLLRAAARLVRDGRRPGLEEVAAAALVSRATAYRYFPSAEALLVEAALDVAVPEPAELFAAGAPADPVARLELVDRVLHDMILANEPGIRLMLANSLRRGGRGPAEGEPPARQNRRTPLIEAALAPALAALRPAARRKLAQALALVIGTEGVIVLRDVLQLPDAEARAVKRWAIRALVEAARRPAGGPGPAGRPAA